MNLTKKMTFGVLISMGSLCFFPKITNAQTNQTLGQCIKDVWSRSISQKEAAQICVDTLKYQEPTQKLGQCIKDVWSRSISQKEAAQICRYLLQQQAQNSNQNRSNPTPRNVQLGGSPQAIENCIKRLMYERRPVCTRRRCAQIGSPEANANRSFGGWQWKTVRTSMSESSAVRACQNAR